jgi:hypothetical protein
VTQLVVEKETLKKWQKALDEPKNPARACFNIAEEIYDFLSNAEREERKPKKEPKRTSLAFHEVIPGDEYEIFNIGGQKYAILNGQRVTCVQKNRTKVVVVLQKDLTSLFKTGHKFTIPTSCLRELANE